MRYFDLHCDTVSNLLGKENIISNKYHVDLTRASAIDHYIQCFALFIPDTIPEHNAFAYYQKLFAVYKRKVCNHKSICSLSTYGDLEKIKIQKLDGAILTVENASAIGGSIDNLDILSDNGVKVIALTWNGANSLGHGAGIHTNHGLTEFGKQALRRMNQLGIIADVSHANESMFADVLEHSTQPVVATHSNAKKICPHPRNLTDLQFAQLRQCKGLVGLTFYPPFLCDDHEAGAYDLLRHVEHFLSLGGEDILAIGSDFDGADMPADISGIEAIPKLYEFFLSHNFSEQLVDKLFFANASRFFNRNYLL